jgi:hypothetical protein
MTFGYLSAVALSEGGKPDTAVFAIVSSLADHSHSTAGH